MELIAIDGITHKVLPVVAIDLLDIKLPLHFSRAVLDVFLICANLGQNHLQVSPSNFLNLTVLGTIGELCEVGIEFEYVIPAAYVSIEAFHVVVGLFGDDEEGDAVVGVDVVEGVDEGSDVLEDEHDVVATVQVQLLVTLQGCCYLLLLLVLLT